MFFGRPPLVGSLLPFLLIQESFAQSGPGVYSLDAVPTTACDGKAGSGSATFSTEYPLDTSVTQLNIYSDGDKGYAKQKGALWKICKYFLCFIQIYLNISNDFQGLIRKGSHLVASASQVLELVLQALKIPRPP